MITIENGRRFATPVDAVVRAALACDDEADFLARLRRRR